MSICIFFISTYDLADEAARLINNGLPRSFIQIQINNHVMNYMHVTCKGGLSLRELDRRKV